MIPAADRLALAAAAITGIQVGAAMVASRYVVHEVGPASLALLRYAIAVACLLPALVAVGRVRFLRADLLAILALGILQFAVLIALLNFGLLYLPAARATLVFATLPLLSLLAARLLGRERLGLAATGGIALTIIGVAVALGEDLVAAGGGEGQAIGALAVLAAALCGAVCAVLYRPYLERYPTLPVSALAMFASVIALLVPAAMEGLFAEPPRLTAPGWIAVAFVGASSGLGYVLWLWALRHTSPSRVTMFLSLGPVTAALLGAWWLEEPLTPGAALGVMAVAGGLWIAGRQGEPH